MVRNPPKTVDPKDVFAPWCDDQKIGEHVSGSILETELSPIKQDTHVAPDIGRENHDYSCSSNAESR